MLPYRLNMFGLSPNRNQMAPSGNALLTSMSRAKKTAKNGLPDACLPNDGQTSLFAKVGVRLRNLPNAQILKRRHRVTSIN